MTKTAAEAVRPILRAESLSRYRLVDVVCPKDHRLLEVVRTPDGPVMLFRPGSYDADLEELPDDNWELGYVAADHVEGLGLPAVGADGSDAWARVHKPVSGRTDRQVWWFRPYGEIQVWCRCSVAVIDLTWVAAQAKSDRQTRVTWPPDAIR